ncbi:putative membrane-associated protein [Endozoicomonas montiporae CL-33]|uniref:Putative membrane-associated protein n=1 Tax=Endozoicomonas montiporae CL-33 TaxID=570277 RepID=A0A142B8Q8_9GAMM|nr:putative membrane-associated protein [Endozoicomonas montiporae CL-33]
MAKAGGKRYAADTTNKIPVVMELSYFDSIHAWLEIHHIWLGPVIAIAAFLETLVVVGFLLPGVAILFALGALAGGGLLGIVPVFLWAFLGAALGDAVSYQLGYHYHDRVRGWWPFSKHADWLNKGERFVRRFGVMSIALGRFVGPIRPVVPVVAGMLNMSPRQFYITNLLSSVPWAVVYLTPGYLAGSAVELDKIKNIPDWGWWTIGVSCLVLGLVVWLIKAFRKKY